MSSKRHEEYEAFKQQTLAAMKADEQDGAPKRVNLSDFQAEKLTRFFQVWFDSDHDGLITRKDFDVLNERILKYTGWKAGSAHIRVLSALHNSFWTCLLESAHKTDYFHEKVSVDLNTWLDLWGSMVDGAMSMRNFPYWVQLLPAVMFLIIDRNEDGLIDKNELRRFYHELLGGDASKVDSFADLAFKRMTANGDFELTNELYAMVFANFILGRNKVGPGQYVLGMMKGVGEEEPIRLLLPTEEEEPEGRAKQKRRAHFLIQQVARASYDD